MHNLSTYSDLTHFVLIILFCVQSYFANRAYYKWDINFLMLWYKFRFSKIYLKTEMTSDLKN